MTRYLFCVALCIAALGGCSAPRYASDAEFRADLGAPYQLASGDRLRVIVFGQEQLTN